jgi:hypothetical protein
VSTSAEGVSASSEEGLSDSMARRAVGEAGFRFPGKDGFAINVLLGREVAMHGFEDGTG